MISNNSIFPFLFLIFSCVIGHAQDATENGFVVSGGKRYYGHITVNIEGNYVRIKEGRDIKIWNSMVIEEISIKEGATGEQKNYQSAVFGNATKPVLFEVLTEGIVSLIYREGVKFDAYDTYSFPPFFVLIDSQIYSLGKSKKEILGVFDSTYKEDLLDYIKEMSLKLDEPQDLIALFEYYNSVFIDELILTNN